MHFQETKPKPEETPLPHVEADTKVNTAPKDDEPPYRQTDTEADSADSQNTEADPVTESSEPPPPRHQPSPHTTTPTKHQHTQHQHNQVTP